MSENVCPKCFRPFKKDRSIPENNYYWAVPVKIIGEHLGYGKEETHEILKKLFLTELVHIKHKDGTVEEIEIVKSTKKLTTVRFEQYLTDIRTWGDQALGCYIPLPNEATEE